VRSVHSVAHGIVGHWWALESLLLLWLLVVAYGWLVGLILWLWLRLRHLAWCLYRSFLVDADA
jgi:hypothetical protein